MARRVATSRSDVPYLTKEQIQREAALLLAEHVQRSGTPITLPIPVEEILEFHLKLTFEIADMRSLFGVADVLGALWINEKIVRVDASLDPSKNPIKLGRYRFTLAHEAGHWRLHRTYFLENTDQLKLFGTDGKPVYVCRAGQKSIPIEWQANYFAAHLLMPSDMLRSAWKAWRGNLEPVYLEDLWAEYGEDTVRNEVRQRSDASKADQHTSQNAIMEMFIRPLASKFEVSAEALRIRLEEFGLMLRERSQLLF